MSGGGIDWGRKRLFLLDMDGTLYLGDRLFDGTAEFLRQVRRRGGRYLFVTNNSSRGAEAYVKRLERLGLPAEEADFLTSVDAAVWYLRSRGLAAERIYVSGTASLRDHLRREGFRVAEGREEGISVLLQGFDTELTFQKLEDACRLLKDPEVRFLATNPDWVCPTEWGAVPDCGSVCEMLYRATGRRPRFLGKPEPDMALLAMERWGCGPEETVLIGDRVYTDIACGVRAGIDTAFVLSGEGVPEDPERFGVSPSETCRDIREILEKLEKEPAKKDRA